jgi:hypothetical protein
MHSALAPTHPASFMFTFSKTFCLTFRKILVLAAVTNVAYFILEKFNLTGWYFY